MDDTPILYADDDDNDRFIFRRVLQKTRAPTSLHTVDDGLYAIDYLSGHGSYEDRGRHPFPQLILSDLKMPRVSGIGLLRWVRKQTAFASIPFVLFSSSSHGSDIQSAFDLGANGYMVKTSSLDNLCNQIAELLQACRAIGYRANGCLTFAGNKVPPPAVTPDALHPATVLCQSSWSPALKHPEH